MRIYRQTSVPPSLYNQEPLSRTASVIRQDGYDNSGYDRRYERSTGVPSGVRVLPTVGGYNQHHQDKDYRTSQALKAAGGYAGNFAKDVATDIAKDEAKDAVRGWLN